MSRNRRRAVAVAIVGAIAVAPMVSACAAGRQPQSLRATRLTEGVNASTGHIAVRNAFVLGPDPGQRLPVGASAPFYAWFVNDGNSADRLIGAEAPGVAQSVEIANGGLTLPPGTVISTNPQAANPQPSNAPTPGVTPTTGGATKTSPGATGAPSSGAQTPGAPAGATPPAGGTPPTATTPSTGGSSAAGTPSGAATSVILRGLTKELTGSETIRLILHFQQAGSLTMNVPVLVRQGYYATYPPAPGGTTPTAPGGSASLTAGSAAPTAGATGPAAGTASPGGTVKHARPGKSAKHKKAASPRPTA